MDNQKLISINTNQSSINSNNQPSITSNNQPLTPIKLDFNFISTPYIEKKAIYDIKTFIENTEKKNLCINTSK